VGHGGATGQTANGLCREEKGGDWRTGVSVLLPAQSLWPSPRSLQHRDPKQRALTPRGLRRRGARVSWMLQERKTRQSRGAPGAALLQLSKRCSDPCFIQNFSPTWRHEDFGNRATYLQLSPHFRHALALRLGLGGGRGTLAARYTSAPSTPHSLAAATSPALLGSRERPPAEPPRQQRPQSSALPVESQGDLQFAVGDRWDDAQNDVLKLEQREKWGYFPA